MNNRAPAVAFLLQLGANPLSRNYRGQTVTELALESRARDVLSVLVTHAST